MLQLREDAAEIVSRLIELSFFKFTPVDELNQGIEMLRDSLTRGSLDTYDYRRDDYRGDPEVPYTFMPYDRRIYMADAEGLCEGDVGDLLQLMKPVLAAEGAHFDSLREEFCSTSYFIVLDGQTYKIYDETDPLNWWFLSHKRATGIINELLQKAGSRERAYGISSGNDAMIALLTDELYEFLRCLPLNRSMKPYQFDEVENEEPGSSIKLPG